ncbi:MAG: glutaredoxin 3 [Pseudomonadota bacterium]
MATIEMYGTGFCPYCVRARLLLEKKEAPFTDIRIDREPHRRGEMEERAGGASSVPQIFINGQHIGGCDELYELDFDGKLDPMLAGPSA